MFDWTTHAGYLYMPAWVREIGAMMQLLPLLLVPFVGVIQSFRYFLNGHGPLHEVRVLGLLNEKQLQFIMCNFSENQLIVQTII